MHPVAGLSPRQDTQYASSALTKYSLKQIQIICQKLIKSYLFLYISQCLKKHSSATDYAAQNSTRVSAEFKQQYRTLTGMDLSRRNTGGKRTSDLHLLTSFPALGYPNHSPRCTGQRPAVGTWRRLQGGVPPCPSSMMRKRSPTTHQDHFVLLLPCHLTWGCSNLRSRCHGWTSKQMKGQRVTALAQQSATQQTNYCGSKQHIKMSFST